MRPRLRRRAAMTLLEVLVGISVILVMMVMALQAIDNALKVRDLLENRDGTTRSARVALGRLRHELRLAFLTEHRQAINTYETVFIGRDANPDTIWFASLSHQRLYRDARESDQTEITVWAEPAPSRGRGYVLYHREAPRIDEEPALGGRVLPLAHDVRSFELRYLDGMVDEWRDVWDTRSADTPNRLPRAVQIGLVLIADDPRDPRRTVDIPFITTVILDLAVPFTRGLPLGGGAPGAAPPGGMPPGAGAPGAMGRPGGAMGRPGGGVPGGAAPGRPR